MEVTVDQIAFSDVGLRLGCVVTYGDGGPVRFVPATLRWELFDAETRGELLVQFNRLASRHLEEEPLF